MISSIFALAPAKFLFHPHLAAHRLTPVEHKFPLSFCFAGTLQPDPGNHFPVMEQTESMGKPAFALDQLGWLFLQDAGILRMDPVPVQHPSRIGRFAGAAQDLIKSRVASGQYLPP